jgi:4-hydroxy-tetrahydrodipicolinate synthase
MTATTDLWGSFTPLVTPFLDGKVDHHAFERLVARQIECGGHGIVVTGTTGEPTSLSPSERRELYGLAVAAAGGRRPVVAATGSPNQEETIALTRAAEGAGVDAVLVVCPAFVRPSQEGLVGHFAAVAACTELPLLIYNIPGRAAVGVSPETVERIAASCPNVVGLKHASPDLDFVTDVLLRLGDDFRIFCGLESLSYPMLALGAAGLMSAVGNLFPREIASLCEAVRDADHAAALSLHRSLFRLNQAIFADTNPVPLKHMLHSLGLGSPEVRPPLAPLGDAARGQVEQALAGAISELGIESSRRAA